MIVYIDKINMRAYFRNLIFPEDKDFFHIQLPSVEIQLVKQISSPTNGHRT